MNLLSALPHPCLTSSLCSYQQSWPNRLFHPHALHTHTQKRAIRICLGFKLYYSAWACSAKVTMVTVVPQLANVRPPIIVYDTCRVWLTGGSTMTEGRTHRQWKINHRKVSLLYCWQSLNLMGADSRLVYRDGIVNWGPLRQATKPKGYDTIWYRIINSILQYHTRYTVTVSSELTASWI